MTDTTGKPLLKEFDIEKAMPEIVRDLELGDLAKKERDVLRSYNTDLQKDNAELRKADSMKTESLNKANVKLKRSGKAIFILIVIDVLIVVVKLL